MKIKLLAAFFILFFFLSFPAAAFSKESFSVASDITYTISQNEMAHVVINMSLTNTTSQYYASQNTIRVGFTSIENVKAFDPDGPIVPEVSKDEKGYTIKVKFNKRVVGIDKTLPFTISFDTPDIVQKQGNIHELDIPGIADQNSYTSFNVHVRVPPSFGPPQYIKPDVGTKTLDFTKENLGKGGISIAFGENQLYAFSLKYHINNTHVFPIRTEIALPPNTNYQQVAIDSIDPPPLNVKKDADGNWLAQYSLLPSAEKDIFVSGKVKVSLFPQKQEETKETLAKYLAAEKYWESNDERIQTLAKTLKTPQAIYEYVAKKLSYDFSRVTERKNRLGAAAVLQDSDSAVCLEFTDLFIALARSAGIPAREIDGFGYTQNAIQRPLLLSDDILHAWPQYYDSEKKTWIMVDPTWGNTTGGVDYFNVLDFSHIAFVIKGSDSSYPVPAGGYKVLGQKINKDVTITPLADNFFPNAQAKATLQIGKKYFAGVPITGTVRVVNTGGVVYPSQELSVTSQGLSPTLQKIVLPQILPFGKVDVPFSFEKTALFMQKNATITVRTGDSSISETIVILPLYALFFEKSLLPWTIGGLFVASSTIIIIFIIARRFRNISVS